LFASVTILFNHCIILFYGIYGVSVWYGDGDRPVPSLVSMTSLDRRNKIYIDVTDRNISDRLRLLTGHV